MGKFCIYCGNEMKEWDKFCIKCGKKSNSFIACVKSVEFHIAGITEYEKELNKLIRNLKENCYLENFQGMTKSEIEDYGDISIYEDQIIEGVKIEEDEYEGKLAFKVLVKNGDDEFIHLGYVPKKSIKEVQEFLNDERINDEHYNLLTEYEIVGGKRKEVICDYDGKCSIEEKELNYGIRVMLSIIIK